MYKLEIEDVPIVIANMESIIDSYKKNISKKGINISNKQLDLLKTAYIFLLSLEKFKEKGY